jgi:hypothetical protein
VKLLYAIAFALFPLAAPAQTPDSSSLTTLCQDDYYEDTSGQCSAISAGEVLTIEAILERYGVVVITRDADEEIAGAFLADPEDIPVGSINPPSEIPAAEHAILTDENSGNDPTAELDTVASHIVTPEAQLQTSAEGEDEIVATGPTARRIPAVATEPIPDNLAVE